jgi:hypothetical protein
MRKYLTLPALALILALPTTALAGSGFFVHGTKVPDQYGFKKSLRPRAAPWFLYWPYPAHFNAPAPTGAAFPPESLSPGNFHPHMYQGVGPGTGFAPYPTNGYGQ